MENAVILAKIADDAYSPETPSCQPILRGRAGKGFTFGLFC